VERRETKPWPGFTLVMWGVPVCAVVGGIAFAAGHFVIGTSLGIVVAVGLFAYSWFQLWYDRRLRASGVVIDRSAWHRERIVKGDRQAKWLAFYGLGSMALIGTIVVVLTIAKAT
jgi:hypothetical protein